MPFIDKAAGRGDGRRTGRLAWRQVLRRLGSPDDHGGAQSGDSSAPRAPGTRRRGAPCRRSWNRICFSSESAPKVPRGTGLPRHRSRSDPRSQTREVTMLRTTRSLLGVGVLTLGCPLALGTSAAQAQVLASPQAQFTVSPAPLFFYPAARSERPAPLFFYAAGCYSMPAPSVSSPGRTWAYQPGRRTPPRARPCPRRPKRTPSPIAAIPITIQTASSTTPAIRTGVLIRGAPDLSGEDESPGARGWLRSDRLQARVLALGVARSA